MSYIDLVWAGMAVFGGLLLIEDFQTTTKAKVGIWLIFVAYMFQVYWEFTHPWKWPDSLMQVISVSVIFIFSFSLAFGSRFLKKKQP
jgi:hypothetical protein